MKFLVDECVGKSIYNWLKDKNYNVFLVTGAHSGANDDWVLEKAFQENRILITCDKDFGDMIFRDQKHHKGIVLLRLKDESSTNKIRVFSFLLENYEKNLTNNNNFVLASDENIRIVQTK